LKIEKGSTRSLSVGNFLWKRLWTGRKTDYGMSGGSMYIVQWFTSLKIELVKLKWLSSVDIDQLRNITGSVQSL